MEGLGKVTSLVELAEDMKVVIAFLLFASATAEIHNWVGLPEARFEQLDKLLEGTYLFCSVFVPTLISFVRHIESVQNSRSWNACYKTFDVLK